MQGVGGAGAVQQQATAHAERLQGGARGEGREAGREGGALEGVGEAGAVQQQAMAHAECVQGGGGVKGEKRGGKGGHSKAGAVQQQAMAYAECVQGGARGGVMGRKRGKGAVQGGKGAGVVQHNLHPLMPPSHSQPVASVPFFLVASSAPFKTSPKHNIPHPAHTLHTLSPFPWQSTCGFCADVPDGFHSEDDAKALMDRSKAMLCIDSLDICPYVAKMDLCYSEDHWWAPMACPASCRMCDVPGEVLGAGRVAGGRGHSQADACPASCRKCDVPSRQGVGG